MTRDRYIESCPVGCMAPFVATGIVLPEGPLLRCPECGQLVSQITAAAYHESMARFDEASFNDPAGRELARRNEVAARRLRRIAALLGRSPGAIRLLDVGCSRGHFVETAAKLGFAAEGVEPAPGIAAAASSRGLTVHGGLLEDQRFADTSFDAVTLFEVIEHLREPAPLFAECRRILAPAGLLMLSTGNAASWTARAMKGRWDYFHVARDAGHVSFFNPRSLRLVATRCGFTVERIETARVKFFEKGDVPRAAYIGGKLAAELLNLPARLAAAGHDMLACLRRR
ncbi:MAG: class I SAM-dependent methyltransferase [Burkholderiales bacterium]|nr:class I SAM-dependent methyltransferase [Burkholderiales bacterium]